MKISDKGLEHIMKYEGFEDEAYMCPANVLTIGYGHTKTVKPGQKISQKEAKELLRKDVEYFENEVKKLVKVPMTQGVFDSLVSFTFNVGENALRNSTLLRLLNQGFYARAGDELLKWVRADGRVLEGLRLRREDERKLFYSQPFPKV